MRKAGRKQKKLDNLRQQGSSTYVDKLESCKALDIPDTEELEVIFELKKTTWDSDVRVRLGPNDFGSFAKGLACNNTVERIICSINPIFFDYLSDALKINTSVRTLLTPMSLSNYSATSYDTYSKALPYIANIIQYSSLTSFQLMFRPSNQTVELVDLEAVITALKNNTKLTSFAIPAFKCAHTQYKELIQAIKDHSTIVDVSVNPLICTPNYIEELADLVKATNRINSLNMDQIEPWKPEIWTPVLNALKENTSLTDVSLAVRNYRFETRYITSTEVELLAEVLRQNQTITKLDITGNNLGSDLVTIVLDSLQHNKTLTKLDFWGNRLNSAIQLSIEALLNMNETLTEIDLSHAKLQWPDLIGPALKNNKSVTALDLSFNDVGSLGCIYLADGLKFNKTLTRLNLKESKVDDEGCLYLSKAIKTNQCLLHLDISGQDIKMDGYKALIEGLGENDSLTDLVLSRDKNVPYHMHEKILELQNKNKLYRQTTIITTITILIQIARSGAFEMFPLEIWLRIYKHLVCGGIPGFNCIAETILMHSDVWDLPSLCKMRIVQINGKSWLIQKDK